MAKKTKKPATKPVRKRRRNAASRPPPEGVDPYQELAKEIKPKRGKGRRAASDGLELIKNLAEIRYVTDPMGISVREMVETEPFNTVHFRTVSQWCSDGDWVEKRQKHFEDIRDGIKKSMGKRLVKISVEQLKELDAAFKIVKKKFKESKPKSMEGLVGAMTGLVKTSNELRDRIAAEIVPGRLGGPAEQGIQITPKLTEKEARVAARAILHERRAAMRAEAAKKDADDGGDEEKPALRLVEGGADE